MALRSPTLSLARCCRSHASLRHLSCRETYSAGTATQTNAYRPSPGPSRALAASFGTSSTTKASFNASVSPMPSAKRNESRQIEQLSADARAMERNFTRDWQTGDVYAPHDLSAAEARKFKKKQTVQVDAFDMLSLNPLDCYKNVSIMSEYITEMGRIRHSKDTGLRPVNQRKIAKAIRRAVGVGLMPSVHRHPEIVRKAILDARRSSRPY